MRRRVQRGLAILGSRIRIGPGVDAAVHPRRFRPLPERRTRPVAALCLRPGSFRFSFSLMETPPFVFDTLNQLSRPRR